MWEIAWRRVRCPLGCERIGLAPAPLTLRLRARGLVRVDAASHLGEPRHGLPPCGLRRVRRVTADDDADQHFYFGVILQSLLSLLVIPLALWAW